MASNNKPTFNATVSARTRLAAQVLTTAELLAKYERLGGLPGDLELIRDVGHAAEAANHAQGVASRTARAPPSTCCCPSRSSRASTRW